MVMVMKVSSSSVSMVRLLSLKSDLNDVRNDNSRLFHLPPGHDFKRFSYFFPMKCWKKNHISMQSTTSKWCYLPLEAFLV